MNLTAFWENAQPAIKEIIGPTAYDTWFSSLQIKTQDPQTLLIETPDEFFKNWIIEHYLDIIENTVRAASSLKNIQIKLSVNSQPLERGTQDRLSHFEKESQNFKDIKKPLSNLNPRFSFENFVVGP